MTHRPVLVSLVIVLLLLFPAAVSASPPGLAAQDTSAHRFRGFRAGARLDEMDALVRRAGGGGLRCDRAKRDPRVSECRGIVPDSVGPMRIWVSAMDSVAGIVTLSAAVDSSGLSRWRRELERAYGRVAPKVQGGQTMLQWVRRGRMLRLTWRSERGELTASVSLVDGRVLDAWGAEREARSR
ncbi:MAG TPA: hypothetical protein VF061_09060 [Gemmatimonadales bacterium]|jgi:hypothetical protein